MAHCCLYLIPIQCICFQQGEVGETGANGEKGSQGEKGDKGPLGLPVSRCGTYFIATSHSVKVLGYGCSLR